MTRLHPIIKIYDENMPDGNQPLMTSEMSHKSETAAVDVKLDLSEATSPGNAILKIPSDIERNSNNTGLI